MTERTLTIIGTPSKPLWLASRGERSRSARDERALLWMTGELPDRLFYERRRRKVRVADVLFDHPLRVEE
jgi:hypothetical protein